MNGPVLTEIGSFGKPHGIKGEISASLDFDGIELSEGDFVFAGIDGLDVPFRVLAVRTKGSGYLLTLKGIDDEKSAALLANKPLKMSDIELDDEASDQIYLEDLIGYTVTDGDQTVGKISGYDEPTADNPLFVVELPQGDTVLIPANDELICDIDFDRKTIEMDLPAGLIDLNSSK